MFTNYTSSDYAKAVIAALTNLLVVVTSMQEHIEWGLRIMCLLLGIIAAIPPAIKAIKNWRK